MWRKYALLVSLIFVLSLTGCGLRDDNPSRNKREDSLDMSREGSVEPSSEPTLYPWDTAWLVYWDGEQDDELSNIREDVQNVCLFSCLYSEEGDLIVPEGIDALASLAASYSLPTVYLSFTNDVRHADGSVTQKDASFLSLLWSDEAHTQGTVREMLDAAHASGANAIEIDFENIGKAGVWQEFVTFLETLLTCAREEAMPVRVVLGSDAPVQKISFPEGAFYTVMCYNLYGTHSGPGPKADFAFLRKVAEKFSTLSGVHYALATGGFEWDGTDKVTRSLTQAQAEEIAAQRKRTPERDEESMALHFTYRDGLSRYTVWYADAVTLAAWQQEIISVDPDANFDLWRIGGNRFE